MSELGELIHAIESGDATRALSIARGMRERAVQAYIVGEVGPAGTDIVDLWAVAPHSDDEDDTPALLIPAPEEGQ